jgi:flagellar biosynthesis protein FlhF
MRLKYYTAKSMQEGLRLIQKDLGDDAIMLSSKSVTLPDGSKGVEITAAVEKFTPAKEEKKTAQPYNFEQLQDSAASRYIAPSSVEEKLLQHGVSGKIASKIGNAIGALQGSGFETEDCLEMILGKLINFQISSKVLTKGRPIVLIGSTGAGKTTTIAKLSVSKVMAKNSVGLINMDTFKVGAKEQIKLFADALQVESRVVKSPEELSNTVSLFQHKQKDFILIDSAGLNPFKQERLLHLQKMLSGLDNPYVALVLPANLNAQELANIPFAFKGIEISGLIFSKMDETHYLGGIVNAAIESQLEVCFATDGQNIPQDIMELDAKSLARRLLDDIQLPWGNV